MCVKMKTRQHYLRKCARCSVDVVAGVRIVRCHASIDVVIDVCIVECHASMDVVIGIRVVLCHPLKDFFTSCPILILLSCCSYSSKVLPVNFGAHILHRGNTSFEVWYLHSRRYNRPPSAVNDPSVTKLNEFKKIMFEELFQILV